MFFTIAFPLMLLLFFGAIFGNEPDPSFNATYGYVDMSVPAIGAMIIGTVALMGIPVTAATAREQKILRRYSATPLNPRTYLVAELAVQLVTALAGMAILIVMGKLLFNLRFDGAVYAVLAAFLFSFLAFIATGFLIAGLAPTARTAQTVGMVLYFPMLFLSGATIPRAIMPENVRNLGEFLPMTHVVTLLQGLWFGEPWSAYMTQSIVLGVMLVAGFAVSALTFRWE